MSQVPPNPSPFMKLPLEIRFEIYSLCLGSLTSVKAGEESYTQRSCQEGEDDAIYDDRHMSEAPCSCLEEKLRDYKMFAVSMTIYKEAERFYFARNEFWIYDLVAFEAFARKELHRELVTRIVLFYGTGRSLVMKTLLRPSMTRSFPK